MKPAGPAGTLLNQVRKLAVLRKANPAHLADFFTGKRWEHTGQHFIG